MLSKVALSVSSVDGYRLSQHLGRGGETFYLYIPLFCGFFCSVSFNNLSDTRALTGTLILNETLFLWFGMAVASWTKYIIIYCMLLSLALVIFCHAVFLVFGEVKLNEARIS